MNPNTQANSGQILWINNHDSAATSRMRWEYEYRRIKHVLSRKSRGKIVRDLTSKNEELQKLFSSSERLSNYRVQRKAPTRFRRIREQASALYNVLEKAWKCQCTGKTPAHQANLLLENRNGTGGKKRGFHLEDSSEARLDILLLCKPETNRFPLSWRETEVVLLEPEEDCPTPSTASRSKPVSSDPTDSGTDIQWHPPLTTRSRKVKFPNVIIHPSAGAECRSVAALAQIHDLCSAVMHGHGINGTVEEPLGYLLDDQSRRHAFYPSTRPPVFTQYTETVTLGSLISQSRRPGEPDFEKTRLSRLERYSIAATLASSILQLYNSPWVGESWSKNDIYFVKAAEGSPIFDRPYVTRRFKSSLGGDSIASGNKASIRDNSVKSIEALGIMLLELCFGEAIEDQPFRKKYLGADGQPNDMTDFCTAKQWWENHALGEGGPDFHTAIRRCLFCAFAPKSTSLEDEELCAALYSEVVEPLESTVRHFTSEL